MTAAPFALLAAGLALAAGAPAPLPDPYPDIARAYYVEIDGVPRWGGRADDALPIASLTKLMTAVLVAESGRADDEITITQTAAAETGTRLGLQAGDRARRGDLLAAMLVRSANDACRALADAIGGDEARFVARMNARAAELGLTRTRFANACGHDHDDNHASARDLATLTRTALSIETIATDVARESFTFSTQRGRRHVMRNTNALLGTLAGVRGVKTGWTPRAARCLIVYAERDGRRVLAVLLAAPDRWWDSAGLIERAFDDGDPAR
ncbi:MAG TPA: serine hydrolase [Dokdonella sp.]|nr:serine hydrolase [Dokdonella sp.]